MKARYATALALFLALTLPAMAGEHRMMAAATPAAGANSADATVTGSLPPAAEEGQVQQRRAQRQAAQPMPNVVDLFFSKKNPMAQMAIAMNEACPSDVLGLMRDVGELVGLAEPPKLELPEGTFADKMRALAEQRHVQKSLLERMLSRSCLYNRLFGDGTCGK